MKISVTEHFLFMIIYMNTYQHIIINLNILYAIEQTLNNSKPFIGKHSNNFMT